MKYKRRIIYIDDETWGGLIDIAGSRRSTISATIRDMLEEPIRGEKMARESLRGKVLHHMDGDPYNNDPSNLALRDA